MKLSCSDAVVVFFFNDTATTEIYTLSLHDALPISSRSGRRAAAGRRRDSDARRRARGTGRSGGLPRALPARSWSRSEEHTSELQSRQYLVCRLLLEKKKKSEIYKQATASAVVTYIY